MDKNLFKLGKGSDDIIFVSMLCHPYHFDVSRQLKYWKDFAEMI